MTFGGLKGIVLALGVLCVVILTCEGLPQQGTTNPPRTCNAPITSTKDGKCPTPNPQIRCIWCNDSCRSDADCPGATKCCSVPACGNGCSNPV